MHFNSVEKAIIIDEVKHWCKVNERKGSNEYDGKHWTRLSSSDISEMLPYLKRDSIKRWLRELVKDGILMYCIDNKHQYDKTKSYRVNIELYNKIIIEACGVQVIQIDQGVGQNDQGVGQNDQGVGQNDQTIPTPNPTPNTSTNDIAKSDDLPKLAFLAIDGLKKKIGPKHYELLKEACTSDEIKPIVDAMLSDGRFEKLMDWLEYKKKTRKGLNVSWAIKSLIKEASAFDLIEVNEALKKATQSGYTGIFFKKISQKQREYLEQLNPETPNLNVAHKKELSENEIEKRETLLAMIAFREAQAARKSQTA
jgi:hypothetical protein